MWASVAIVSLPALDNRHGAPGSADEIPVAGYLRQLKTTRTPVRNETIRQPAENPVQFAGQAVEANAVQFWIGDQQVNKGQGVLCSATQAISMGI